ncbi:toxin-antitoxin system HicB family antitoxin [Nitratireductor aquibiodomus]|uniref:toxin-antitoxin system HicB family antitoxin n=1 Tax=Nitratireductor TaxID=245876 RepID=UPI000DDDA488|nr:MULTISPECIES: toxin-antitoxin system HicB family antitoxin [Nitratireductor]MBN7763689.1 toxin-antitoxin system HicB family antitoxin [Nitratireductor aquibiodomus]
MRGHPMMRIRISPELKDRLEAAAKEHNRSLNAEVVEALEKHLGQRKGACEMAALEYRVTVLEESVKLLSKMTIHEGLGEGD